MNNINEILEKNGLSTNSSFYAGRGIEYGDITVKILCNISRDIKRYLGTEKQKVFNQMVLDLPTLKASFLIDFALRLEIVSDNNEWWWDKERMLSYYSTYYNQDLLSLKCQQTEEIKKYFRLQMQIK